MPMRTPSGDPSAQSRKEHSATKDGRFPIFDRKSALAAIALRHHNTTAHEVDMILTMAAKFAPDEAKAARQADKKNG